MQGREEPHSINKPPLHRNPAPFKYMLIWNQVCLSPQREEETYLSPITMQITYLHLVNNINHWGRSYEVFPPSPVNKNRLISIQDVAYMWNE